MTNEDPAAADQQGCVEAQFKDEPLELAKLIAQKAEDGDAEFERFVAHRFYRPFKHSITVAPWYGGAFSAVSVLVISAGLASSALASADQGNTALVVVLGLFVAVATAVNRLWRPGLRAAVRHETANALRREGWSFVCERGEYTEEADRQGVFVDRIERLNVKAENVDEQTPEANGEESA